MKLKKVYSAMKLVDEYFFKQKEPYQSIMLYVRDLLLRSFPEINEGLSYGIPFYKVGKKPLCYLNILKGTNFVDVAFMQGVLLEDKYPILRDYNKRKQVRSIQVESLETFDEEQFIDILNSAIIYMKKK